MLMLWPSYQDTIAANGLGEIIPELQNARAVNGWNSLLADTESGRISWERAKKYMDIHLDENKYLLHNYEYRLFGFDRVEGKPLFSDQDSTLGQMERKFQAAKPTRFPDLRFSKEGYPVHLVIYCGCS